MEISFRSPQGFANAIGRCQAYGVWCNPKCSVAKYTERSAIYQKLESLAIYDVGSYGGQKKSGGSKAGRGSAAEGP